MSRVTSLLIVGQKYDSLILATVRAIAQWPLNGVPWAFCMTVVIMPTGVNNTALDIGVLGGTIQSKSCFMKHLGP